MTVSVAGSITATASRSCRLTYTFRATGAYWGTPVSLSNRNTLTMVSVLTSMTLSAFARSFETYPVRLLFRRKFLDDAHARQIDDANLVLSPVRGIDLPAFCDVGNAFDAR